MGKPSINIGDGNWATKEGFLEGYRQDDNDKFLPVPATVERVGAQTYIDRNGVLQTAGVDYGVEEVVEGDFSNGGAAWTLGNDWGVVNEVAVKEGGNPNSSMTQIVMEIGKTYTFNIRISGSGTLDNNNKIVVTGIGEWATAGYYKDIVFVATSTTLTIQGRNTSIDLYVDDVSIREVIYTDNVPCIDFSDDPNGVLSMPPQSTNLVLWSEDLTQPFWTKNVGTTIELGHSIAGVPANKLISDVGVTIARVYRNALTPLDSNPYWNSVIVKQGEVRYCVFAIRTPHDSSTATIFDMQDGVFTHISSGIIDTKVTPLSDGSYRIGIKFLSVSGNNSDYNLLFSNGGNYADIANFVGDGGGYYCTAFQSELDNLTPYIKTEGATATRYINQVTNIGDVNSFNSEEGVLYWRGKATGETSTIVGISDGGNSNKIEISLNVPSSRIDAVFVDGGVNSFIFNYSTDVLIEHEIAVKWKANDFALYVDEVEVLTDTSGTVSSNAWNKLNLCNVNQTANFLQAETKSLKVYKSIADAQIDKPYIL